MTARLSLHGVATDYFPSHHNLVLLVLGGGKHGGVKCKLFSPLHFFSRDLFIYLCPKPFPWLSFFSFLLGRFKNNPGAEHRFNSFGGG